MERPVQLLNAQALALLVQQAKLRKGMLGAAATQSTGMWLKDEQHLDDLVCTERDDLTAPLIDGDMGHSGRMTLQCTIPTVHCHFTPGT